MDPDRDRKFQFLQFNEDVVLWAELILAIGGSSLLIFAGFRLVDRYL